MFLIQAYTSLFKLIQAYTSLYKQQAGTVAGRFLQIRFGFMRSGSEVWPDFTDLPNAGANFSSEFWPKFSLPIFLFRFLSSKLIRRIYMSTLVRALSTRVREESSIIYHSLLYPSKKEREQAGTRPGRCSSL